MQTNLQHLFRALRQNQLEPIRDALIKAYNEWAAEYGGGRPDGYDFKSAETAPPEECIIAMANIVLALTALDEAM